MKDGDGDRPFILIETDRRLQTRNDRISNRPTMADTKEEDSL